MDDNTRKLSLEKDKWLGNHWPSVEIFPYNESDFPIVLTHLSHELKIPIPKVVTLLNGYASDFYYENNLIRVLMDNYTFSIATEEESLRDKIFQILEMLEL